MASDNKTCILCHKKYRYCGHCKSTAVHEPSWKNAWDTEECMNIFQILADYIHGKTTAVEAKKKLMEYDLKDKDSYSPNMKKAAEEIMAVEIPVEKTENIEIKEQPKKQEFIAKRNTKKSNK